jgi:beta-carotene 15,15'-dioxygenase
MPELSISRSKIGCFACSILILSCIVDRGTGSINFLDWPGAAAGLLLVAGLPHGALDIELLINKADDSTNFSVTASVFVYVSLALGVALLWWLLPTAALIGLLLLSAYHFGGDWSGLERVGERVVVGASLLSAPALAHSTGVADIFSWLVPSDMASVVAGAMYWASLPLLLSTAVLTCFHWGKNRAQCEEIIVVVLSAIVLQPLTFFVIYFCALHSMRHLADVRRTLSSFGGSALVLRGAPYAATAMACCWAGSVFFPSIPAGAAFLSSVFVGLAALTVPHMLLCELPVNASVKTPAVPLYRSGLGRLFQGMR